MRSIDMLSKACEPAQAPAAEAITADKLTDALVDKIANAVIAKLSTGQADAVEQDSGEQSSDTESAQGPQEAAAESTEEGDQTSDSE